MKYKYQLEWWDFMTYSQYTNSNTQWYNTSTQQCVHLKVIKCIINIIFIRHNNVSEIFPRPKISLGNITTFLKHLKTCVSSTKLKVPERICNFHY